MLANITGDWPWLLLVVLVVFGGAQLPKLAKNAGEAMKEFRKAHNEATEPQAAPAPAMPAVAATPIAPTVPTVVAASAPSAVPAQARDEEVVTLTRSQLDAILGTKASSEGTSGTPASN